ncbi:MAG: SAM-dependent methyltransferase [Bryobacteraceae bacterium]
MNALRIVLTVLLASAFAAAQEKGEKLAPYYPTPETVVERMLKLAGVKPGEKLYDLGSGDGRIVIMAADRFKANAVGVEFDADLVKQSTDRIRALGLGKRARIIEGDLLQQDYSDADVITIYLLPSAVEKARPLLEKQLKKGARVVAHDFGIPGWTPAKEEHIEDDGEGRAHTLYLYVR